MNNNTPQRQHTIYTKDILPQWIVKNAKKELLNMDEAVKNQAVITRKSQDNLKEKQNELINYIDNVITKEDYKQLEALDEDFLNKVLNKVKSEEKSLRNDLLGQQESIEMLKEAVSKQEAEEIYLDMEKQKRSYLTDRLRATVEHREVVFSALEYMKRLNIITNSNIFTDLVALRIDYEDIESLWLAEDDKLRKFTDWQKYPGKMLRKQEKDAAD